MRTSRIKAKLAKNEPALLVCLHLTDPSVYELASLMGFDGIWMDLEHHGYSVETALTLMRAARVGGADIMARPAKGEFMRMGRLLEGGAQGIMYPRCDDADEAREVVRWAKFAPTGTRGFDGGNPDAPYCALPMAQYIRAANEQTFVVIQIESPKALENARAIAEVEGVDVLLMGPADFSILSGSPGQFDRPQFQEAVREVAEAARRAGKHWGLPTASVEQTRQIMDMGARFICHGCDLIWVKNGMEQVQRQLGPMGFKFANQMGAS